MDLLNLRVGRGRAIAGIAALTLLAATWTGARADDEQPGAGTTVPSGSKITTSVDTAFAGSDHDDYVLDGYPGQTLSVTVAASKSSTLLPLLEVYRPDGTIVAASDGAKVVPKAGTAPGKKASLTYKINQTGVWTLRVRGTYPARVVKGDNPATAEVVEKSYVLYDYTGGRTEGEYTISVKYGAPAASKVAGVTPNQYGEFRYVVPAVGGATVNATLTFAGGTPTFTSFTSPAGSPIQSAASSVSTKPGKSVTLKNVAIPANSPLGGYLLVFQADPTKPSTKVNLTTTIKLPKGGSPVKGKFAVLEPSIPAETLLPSRGGPDVQVFVTVLNWVDAANESGTPRVFLNRLEMDPKYITTTINANRSATIKFRTPGTTDLPLGIYDLKVTSSTGQAAVLRGGFSVVPAPEAYTLDPVVGSAAGGFPVTIDGANFNPTPLKMAVRFRNLTGTSFITPQVTFPTQTASRLVFTLPMNFLIAGEYAVQVLDVETQRFDELPMHLTLSTTAAINRISPGLVPILGGDAVFVSGSEFLATDKVWLEKAPGSGAYNPTPGAYELMTVTVTSPTLHQFTAPARPKGVYTIYVEDVNGYKTPTRSFAYYQFGALNLGISGGADGYDAWTTALSDFDKDGDLDLFLSRRGGATTLATTSETRVLRNAGNGTFSDITSAVMPAVVASTDDWRADRIWVADITMDDYPDIVIVTNSDKFPPTTAKSKVRLLVSERKSFSQPESDRIFRDRTIDLMAPVRTMSTLYGVRVNEPDDWRGLDMFVGDIDVANQGPPEIVITTDHVFENNYTSCTPYCASPYSGGYAYSFYWGGTRVFKWDQSARSGLGRYKYNKDYFPRSAGVTVAVYNAPVPIPICNGGNCRGRFTPFIGHRLAVAPIDLDGKPDFAVLSNQDVTKQGATISSLQVALNVVGTDGKNGSFSVTDVTHRLTALSETDNFKADAVAIGSPGYPDGNGYGAIAISKADPTGLTSSAIRILRYKPAQIAKDIADFSLVGHLMLPASSPNDRFQASQLTWADVDQDGDADLIALAKSPPGGSGKAFRIFRNEVVIPNSGILTANIQGLVPVFMPDTERFEGSVLSIGDVDGDGALDYVVSRSTTAGSTAPHTRAIRTDK